MRSRRGLRVLVQPGTVGEKTMLTINLVLLLAAFVLTLAAALNPPRVPLWVPVLLLAIAALLRAWPA